MELLDTEISKKDTATGNSHCLFFHLLCTRTVPTWEVNGWK